MEKGHLIKKCIGAYSARENSGGFHVAVDNSCVQLTAKWGSHKSIISTKQLIICSQKLLKRTASKLRWPYRNMGV